MVPTTILGTPLQLGNPLNHCLQIVVVVELLRSDAIFDAQMNETFEVLLKSNSNFQTHKRQSEAQHANCTMIVGVLRLQSNY